MRRIILLFTVAVAVLLVVPAIGCGRGDQQGGEELQVLASMSVLADIAQNVAGDRASVRPIVPPDTDPHAFQPAPSDLRNVSEADLVVLNGADLEGPLATAIGNVAAGAAVIEASSGLASRTPQPGEPQLDDHAVDPHFWLDPELAITYVHNIRDALIQVDPDGAEAYRANAAAYVEQLRALDDDITAIVAQIPKARRKLVMNHASHGYFADAYGFQVVGTIIPSVATGETPSARRLAELTRSIREAGVPAIFVELGADPRLAQQIASETGISVVDDLRDHSLTPRGGVAPTYVDMMRYNAQRITAALR